MEQKNKKEISSDAALSKAQFICSRQEKCSSDIRKKLQEWKVSFSDQENIIQSLIEDKFIDENRYTNFYVRDKFRFNKWGRIKIAYHLKQKQIPEEIISQSIDQLDEGEYLESLKELLGNKIKNTREADPYQLKAKLFRFTQGRGFESHISLKLIDQFISDVK